MINYWLGDNYISPAMTLCRTYFPSLDRAPIGNRRLSQIYHHRKSLAADEETWKLWINDKFDTNWRTWSLREAFSFKKVGKCIIYKSNQTSHGLFLSPPTLSRRKKFHPFPTCSLITSFYLLPRSINHVLYTHIAVTKRGISISENNIFHSGWHDTPNKGKAEEQGMGRFS